MVERKKELKRRQHRKQKLLKLKRRLGAAKTPHDREVLIQRIRKLSPFWTEPVTA